MKKLLAIMLAAVMALSIAGCAAPAAQETVTAEETAAPQETEAAEETVAPQEAASERSATVQQLYADFDAAMEKQLGAMPESFGDIKVGAVVISLPGAVWANMEDCDEAAEFGPVTFGMRRIGLTLMPQHGREVAPVACGADAFEGFGHIGRFGAGQPLVDRRAAAGIDHDAHRGSRDLRIACGETPDGADALHAELLADGGVAVHRLRGAFESGGVVEEVDPAERVGGPRPRRAAPRGGGPRG